MGIFDTKRGGGVNVASYPSDGIFVKKGTIVGCVVDTNCKLVESSQYTDDVALRVKVNYGSFERDEYFPGFWRKEKTAHGWGPPVGLGRAIQIKFFFDACGVDLNKHAQIVGVDVDSLEDRFDPDDVVAVFASAAEEAAGSEILLLDYARSLYEGKVRYGTWNIIGSPEDGTTVEDAANALYNRFMNDVQRGFAPKNYAPHLAEQGDDDDSEPATKEVEYVSDDMPDIF